MIKNAVLWRESDRNKSLNFSKMSLIQGIFFFQERKIRSNYSLPSVADLGGVEPDPTFKKRRNPALKEKLNPNPYFKIHT